VPPNAVNYGGGCENLSLYQKRKKGLFADGVVAAAPKQGDPECLIKQSAALSVRKNIVMI
jgi:hypothetical protein